MTLCSQCGAVLADDLAGKLDDLSDSHGMCGPCALKWQESIDRELRSMQVSQQARASLRAHLRKAIGSEPPAMERPTTEQRLRQRISELCKQADGFEKLYKETDVRLSAMRTALVSIERELTSLQPHDHVTVSRLRRVLDMIRGALRVTA